MTDQNLEQSNDKSANLKPLSPWNPLDYLRLLWWVLVTPKRLVAYREIFGEGAERNVGKWLVSTLLWLPFFIPTLGLWLQILPCTKAVPFLSILPSIYLCTPTIYMWTTAGLLIAWVLTGWLGDKNDVLVASAVSIVAIFVTFVGIRNITLSVASGLIGIAIVLVAAVTYAVADIVSDMVARAVTGLAVALTALDIARAVAGQLGFIVFIIVFAAVRRVLSVMGENVKTGHRYWLAQGAFGALVLAYTFLIWFSFLGGWQMFR